MSAINTFAFQNFLCSPRTRCACVHVFVKDTVLTPRAPVVTARWRLETDQDGRRRLVQHWLKDVDNQTAANEGGRRW